MRTLIALFSGAPRVVQAGVLLLAGGGLVAAASSLGVSRALAVLVAGIALVGLLLLGYEQLLKYLASRKASPMEQAIRGNAAAAPVGIGEPARRARLDDLRKNFETGVQKFRDAGKNLYALPWYLLVGEPGSGKTEAIRHCNVGFPPGLQDQLQGAGGTLNMNWWFTNYAVILDTAGRLMFEEVEPGTTSEWQEFLKLLRRGRPNCPVNGMLLVIPSESLIRDSAEVIERKAGKIAQQLDGIQRALGVRFPVYVVVTKCDLINGFREFFDSISDPGLQHQMMGWSNPAPLDTPFNPEQVDQHLATVKERLVRRRLGLLQDPVNTDDPRARRTDQVDALYEFPEAFMDIAPRLKRYLQMIFVAGEWSSKPLFLRGIYFTSSMREGEALDAKLAEALGVSVESLPEGKVWDRERAYFLRDLFMAKVFREKGLVTRATNTSAQQRTRRNLLYGVSAAGLALLAAFSYLGHTQLRASVVKPAELWNRIGAESASAGLLSRPGQARLHAGAAPSSAWALPVVGFADATQTYFYAGGEPITNASVPDDERTRARMWRSIVTECRKPISVPLVFKPVATLLGDSSGVGQVEKLKAARALFLASVVRPLVEATRAQLTLEAASPADRHRDDDALRALAQLVRLEVESARSDAKPPRLIELPVLMTFLFDRPGVAPEKLAAVKSDAAELQAAFAYLFAESDPAAWPVEAARSGAATGDELETWIAAVADRGGAGDSASPLTRTRDLLQLLGEFRRAEEDLHQLARDGNQPAAQWLEQWRERYQRLASLGPAVEKALESLAGRSLAEDHDRASYEQLALRRQALDLLQAELSPIAAGGASPPSAGSPAMAAGRLNEILSRARARLASPSERPAGDAGDLAAMQELMLAGEGWRRRLAIYSAGDRAATGWTSGSAAPDGSAPLPPGELGTRLMAIREAAAKSRSEMPEPPASASDRVKAFWRDARQAAERAVEVGSSRAAERLVRVLIDHYPRSERALAERVEQAASQGAMRPPERPALPLLADDRALDPRYAPNPAAAHLKDYLVAAAVLGNDAAVPMASADREALASAAGEHLHAGQAYFGSLVRYWTLGLASRTGPLAARAGSWEDFHARLSAASAGPWAAIDEVISLQQAVAEELKPLHAVADEAGRRLLTSLDVAISDARRSLEGDERADFEDLIANWRALGKTPSAACDALVARVTEAGNVRGYCTDLRAENRNFVRGYLHSFGVAGFRSLAGAAAGEAATALQRLKDLQRPPLARWSDGAPAGRELDLDEIRDARECLAMVAAGRSAEPSGAPPGHRTESLCDRPFPHAVRAYVRALLACAPGEPLDKRAIDDMRARLARIPADPRTATALLALVNDGFQPAAGARALGARESVRLIVNDRPGPAVMLAGLAPGEARSIAAVPMHQDSEPVFEFLGEGAGQERRERSRIATRWLPLYLIDRFDSGSAGNDLTVRVTSEDGRTAFEGTIRVDLPPSERPR